ncbi:unnamed protein product [Spodoptera littoralis]|jgi:hypothetical protein|eukprot:gene8993-9737_t
MEED